MGKPASKKRKGPKSTRAGCLLCKPWKRQSAKATLRLTPALKRQLEAVREQMAMANLDRDSISR